MLANPSPTPVEYGTIMQLLSDQFGAVAANVAASYLFEEWGEYGGAFASQTFPEAATVAPPNQVEGATRWAVYAPANGVSPLKAVVDQRLKGILTRLVMQPARETVMAGAHKANTGFARVAEAGACAFCAMLASRGGVYKDSATALIKGGEKFHDDCRCTTIQVRNDSELPASSQQLMKEWHEWAKTQPENDVLDPAEWGKHYRASRKSAE